jgi:hypothetical protein
MRKLCLWLAKHLPFITILTSACKPYLSRYYFFWKDRKWGNTYLHHFHCSDTDTAPSGAYYLHNHPYPWSFSIILVGGYHEYRMNSKTGLCRWKKFGPGSINILSDKDFHRVELIEEDGWSLFFTGWRSRKRSWGFWDPITNEYLDFKNFSKAVE